MGGRALSFLEFLSLPAAISFAPFRAVVVSCLEQASTLHSPLFSVSFFSAAHFFRAHQLFSALLSHDSALSGQRRKRRQSKEWGEPFCFFLIAFPSFFSTGILRAHPHSKCTKVRGARSGYPFFR